MGCGIRTGVAGDGRSFMMPVMSDERIEPVVAPFGATLAPPGSKSLTNRALILAALGEGTCTLSNILLADDSRVMLDGLKVLGFAIDLDESARSAAVHGRGGAIPNERAELFCGNSGTTIRFLAAMCALGRGEYVLDGIARMRQRPIGELVDLLRGLGTRIEYLDREGFPPIRILADRLPGGMARFGAARSSQYLSAALLVGPHARHELIVNLDPGQTSWPYVAMTMRLMDEFSITPELVRDPDTREPRRIIVPRGVYRRDRFAIEPDASNATYFLAAAALHPGSSVTIEGLGRGSLQGDVGFADLLHRMGAELIFGRDFITVRGTDRLEGIDVDLADMPDVAQTLAVTALFADGPTTLRGLHTLRHKETDRLAALGNELARLGAIVEIEDGAALRIEPPTRVDDSPVGIETYDDHRMAMSFALAATRRANVTIRDGECVNKTYPGFFADLRGVLASESGH